MKKQIILLCLLSLMILPAAALGETYRASPGELSALLPQCQAGDVIELADGVYDATNEEFPLLVPRGVTVQAQEGAKPVISSPKMVAAFRVDEPDVTLRGLDIRFLRHGIYAQGDRLALEDCVFTLADDIWRTSSTAMWLGGVREARIVGCEFYGCSISMAGPPVTADTPADVPVLTRLFEVGEDPAYFTSHTIENCTVNGRPLVYIVNQDQVTVSADANAGEIICAGCGTVIVEGADTSNASMGVMLLHNDTVEIRDSVSSFCGIFGFYVAKCNHVLLVNCQSQGTNHGLDVRACGQAAYDHCQAWECDQGLFFSAVDDGLMVDCAVLGTGQGIFSAGGNHNVFLRCLVDSCETGIHFEKEQNAMITGCIIQGCTVVGIRLERSVVAVVDNDFVDNWVGMMAYGNTTHLVLGNRFTANRNCGLFLRNLAYSQVLNNDFTGHTVYSLILEGELNGTTLLGNSLDMPLQIDGVFIEHDSTN